MIASLSLGRLIVMAWLGEERFVMECCDFTFRLMENFLRVWVAFPLLGRGYRCSISPLSLVETLVYERAMRWSPLGGTGNTRSLMRLLFMYSSKPGSRVRETISV